MNTFFSLAFGIMAIAFFFFFNDSVNLGKMKRIEFLTILSVLILLFLFFLRNTLKERSLEKWKRNFWRSWNQKKL